MTRVEVWTPSGADPNDRKRRVEAKRVWSGELAAVPREGDLIEVRHGCASETVKHVTWRLDARGVVVDLEAVDDEGTYTEAPPAWEHLPADERELRARERRAAQLVLDAAQQIEDLFGRPLHPLTIELRALLSNSQALSTARALLEDL